MSSLHIMNAGDAPSSLLDLIDGTALQYEAWTRRGIATPQELLYAVARHSKERRGVPPPPREEQVTVVPKRDLLFFLNDACLGLRFDFGACRRANLLRFGGVFPEQWVAIPKPGGGTREAGGRTATRTSCSPHRHEPPTLSSKHETNLYLSEPTKEVHHTFVEDTAFLQEDLLCPITLELFQDPVTTIHGTTYEREAIEDWLSKHASDPLTGETLPTKLVWPNDAMRVACERVRRMCH